MTEKFLHKHLAKRKEEGMLRSLKLNGGMVDFCSNDYLGFAGSKELQDKIRNHNRDEVRNINGSTGSRLLSGNSKYGEELEHFIANYHKAEAGLIFNSGYDANLGLFSCVPKRGDTVLYDALIHASVHDGMRLSLAEAISFSHNDLNDLEAKLKKAKGNIFVAVESVYSMDGDFAPLDELVSLSKKHNASLIVDEAHATGLFGEKGEGRCVELGIEKKVFARVHTFGKALGVHGAVVLGSENLRNYLINFARPFIYSTALPFHSLRSIKCAYEFLEQNLQLKKTLFERISLFLRASAGKLNNIPATSPIQSIIIGGNQKTKIAAEKIQENGFDVRPILSPTVPKGKERLRICIHTFNTAEEVKKLTEVVLRAD